MEKMMWGVFGHLQEGGSAPSTPLHRAQALCYEAVEQDDPDIQVQMAQEALAISPDCADAYVLLAENAHSPREELEMYEQGVAAGERALGPELFQNDAGHFWGILETRPYMRARLGLAHALWTAGRRQEGVRHLQDMLRLNPNDNQGIRYTLAEFLLSLDRDEELGQLFEQYSEEGSALWSYTRALLAFRRQGDTAESRRLLKMAKGANRHVLEYLLGRKLVPGRQPDYYTPRQESEAIVYARQFLLGWKSTPGAVAWAGGQRQSVPPPPTSPSPLSLSPRGSRPNERHESDGQLLKLLKSLPTRQTVWEADCRPMPSWIQEGDQEVRPWWIVIAEEKEGTVLGQEIRSDPPPVALLWDTLVRTLQFPLVGKPYRPMEIYVRPGLGWESFEGSLDELGIRLVTTDHLDLVDFLQNELTQHLNLQRELGLLDVSGVTPKQLASLYESAALYFQQAPWRKLGYEVPIQIACNKFRSGPWYGIVMGQMGQTLGLTLYENLELLQRLLEGELSEEENLRFTVATTVIFGGPSEIPVADLDAAERHGWKVAGPDAYPWFFHKERGMTTHPPLAWQLELMEACLRTIPDFIQRRGQDDPTQEVMPVTLASGTLEMTLAWIID